MPNDCAFSCFFRKICHYKYFSFFFPFFKKGYLENFFFSKRKNKTNKVLFSNFHIKTPFPSPVLYWGFFSAFNQWNKMVNSHKQPGEIPIPLKL